MDLTASLSIATSGLTSIENGLSVIAKNISNSSTEGYVNEGISSRSTVSGHIGTGVRIGPTTLNVNNILQAALYKQNAQVSSYKTMKNSMGNIESIQGSTNSDAEKTNTLSDQIGNIRSSLISLTATPVNSGAQSTVISNAQSLTNTIHTLNDAYADGRQSAQDNIVNNVASINSNLTQIGELSKKIISLKNQGIDTADLENKRYEIMSDLSSSIYVNFSENSKGDMIVRTSDGTDLPTRPDQINKNDNTVKLPTNVWPLSTSNITMTSSMYYQDGDKKSKIPGIYLDGKDITSHLTGGSLGANLNLRDNAYPKMQAQLDSLSYTLINRFNNSSLNLFTNGNTSDISSDFNEQYPNGIIGLSSKISVNSIYEKSPSLLTTNQGNTGDITLVSKAINTVFGTDSKYVSGTLASPSERLGPNGKISTGYPGEQGIIQIASSLTSDQGATISYISDNLIYSTSVQTTLQSKISNVSGVNVNDELSKTVALQNAYAANAKIISTVQEMFNALINAV